ncbi:MAG: protein BatD [Pseudobacteriovorax sp.]|nr:protein BatD [Pseudobacteriovorax sp.]
MITFLGLCLLLAAPVFGGKIVAELDQNSGTTTDQFVLSIEIEGSFRELPEVPKIDGLSIRPGGRQQSTQIINGVRTSSVTLNYIIEPISEGVFTIPEITLEIDGDVLKTLPLTLTVAKPNRDEVRRRPYFVEREVSPKEVYVGQVFYITERIFIGGPIAGNPGLSPLSVPADVKLMPFDKNPQFSRNLNGKTYRVIEQKYAGIANKDGQVVIPPALVELELNPTGRRSPGSILGGIFPPRGRMIRVKSEAASIEVKPLPVEGRSTEFSGLVGQFELEATLSTASVKTNENVTITARVMGEGHTQSMIDIKLPSLGAKFKVYDDKPEDHDSLVYPKGMIGDRRFSFAVVPQVPGDFPLGEIRLQIFDPIEETYKWLTRDLGTLAVAQGDEAMVVGDGTVQNSSVNPISRDIEVIGSDIVGFASVSQILDEQDLSTKRIYTLVIFALLVFIATLLLFIYMSRLPNREERARRKLQKTALATFHSQLNTWRKTQSAETKKKAHELMAIVNSYFRNKSGYHSPGATAFDLVDLFYQDRAKTSPFKATLKLVDQACYGKPTENIESIADDISKAVKELEESS